MKVVIQDSETKQYLTKDGKWTNVAVNAEKFVEPRAASTFAKGTTTKDFNVVIYFPSATATPNFSETSARPTVPALATAGSGYTA